MRYGWFSYPLFFVFKLFILLLLIPVETAQAQLTLDGEIRPRTELRRGFKTLSLPSSRAAFFTEQRSRMTLTYIQPDYEFKLSVQDVRIWGSEKQLAKTDNLFSLHEAWGKVMLSPSTFLKAGRQELVYDDHRILGNVNWTAQGRSHDALVLGSVIHGWDTHLGLAFNQDDQVPEPAKLFDTFNTGSSYKALQYLWVGKDFESGSVSFLLLNNGLQLPDSTVNYSQTLGLNVSHRLPGEGTIAGSFYYQTGRDLQDRQIAAFLGSLSLTIPAAPGLQMKTGVDYLSGSRPDDSDNRSFNPLYGTNHAFYGLMDYFYVGNPHRQGTGSNPNNAGLVDIYVRPQLQLTPSGSLSLTLHSFLSPVKVDDPAAAGESLSSLLGFEADLAFSWRLADAVILQAGYSQMAGTASLEALKGGDHSAYSGWSWVMLRFHPTLLSTSGS